MPGAATDEGRISAGTPHRVRFAWQPLSGVLGIALLVAAAWWLGQRAALPTLGDTQSQTERERTTVEVVRGSIEQTLRYDASIRREYRPVASNMLSGVVTWVMMGTSAEIGSMLYAVDGLSVRVIKGEQPFYRTLEPGVEGRDVEQLQSSLQELGFYSGDVDGEFRGRTLNAVKRWQQSNGEIATGAVDLGRVIAIPEFPADVSLGDEIHLGALVAPGALAVSVTENDPEFHIELAADQAARIPIGAVVMFSLQQSTWQAKIVDIESGEGGNVDVVIGRDDGRPVCDEGCDRNALAAYEKLPATIHVVPETEGLVVPVSAIATAPGGSTSVEMEDGSVRDILVIASREGLAVVTGVVEGERVVALQEPSRDAEG